MPDDDQHPDGPETTHSADHQRAINATEHAFDAPRAGNLSHAQVPLNEARTAVECASSDELTTQQQREIG